jgi:hypothetical protein
MLMNDARFDLLKALGKVFREQFGEDALWAQITHEIFDKMMKCAMTVEPEAVFRLLDEEVDSDNMKQFATYVGKSMAYFAWSMRMPEGMTTHDFGAAIRQGMRTHWSEASDWDKRNNVTHREKTDDA